MPLPVTLFLFLARSVPCQAVVVSTVSWILANRVGPEGEAVGRAASIRSLGQKQSRGVTEKCSTSARPRKYRDCGTENSRAAEETCPNMVEMRQEGDLLSQHWLGSGFSISQTGLMLFSRKLLWPPKQGKLGESPTLQMTHSEGCRSICYKSSSLGKRRKHNFHKTLLNGENHPGLFFASSAPLLEPFVL